MMDPESPRIDLPFGLVLEPYDRAPTSREDQFAATFLKIVQTLGAGRPEPERWVLRLPGASSVTAGVGALSLDDCFDECPPGPNLHHA